MTKKLPQILKGFRDFGPDQMAARQLIFGKIRAAFERFGFEPMETPTLENLDLLAGKYGMDEKLVYKFKDHGGREVAMRYDLTVPLARFYAANSADLPKPFKRYIIGPVWRGENTQKGRFREFYQCDVDVIGSDSGVADAEVIAAVTTALTEMGVLDMSVRVNNRKIIDGVMSLLGVPDSKFVGVLRALDKLDKLGQKRVSDELRKTGVTSEQIEKMFKMLQATVADSKGLKKVFSEVQFENKLLAEGVGELSEVLDAAALIGVENLIVDLTLARGLDYYTGTVCEIGLSQAPQFGSIAGGGRYNGLIGETSGGRGKVPAVGMSIGIDRLIEALKDLSVLKYDPKADVIVFNLKPDYLESYLTLVTELRLADINAEVYYEPDALDKQFRYAEKKKYNLGLFVGDDEIKDGKVAIKDLVTRKQWKVDAGKIVQEIAKLLS